MKAVSDATPLIHLAKVSKLRLLKKLFSEISIPKEIFEEVVVKGRGKNAEVAIIEELINEKFINVGEVDSGIDLPNLHLGESKALVLCKQLKINNILIDEKEGFSSAEMLSLTPIRTTSLLIVLLDKKIINFREYKEGLTNLSESGYFLDANVYERLLNIGKNLK